MISFRKKKEKKDTFADFKAKLEQSTEFGNKIEQVIDREALKIKTGVNKESIENLSKRIEEENRKIKKRFAAITRKTKQLTLESPEIIELIKLYSKTKDRFEEFSEEMRNIDDRGWDFDNNIAAFYKFRIGKALAEMKKQSKKVETICRDAGFTPSNIKTILDSPIEKLVDSLSKKKIRLKKKK